MSLPDARRSRAPSHAGLVAGLMQGLDDDRLVAEHPLARAFSAPDAATVRENVLQAVERLRDLPSSGERLHAIAARCDLGGELHKIVAADLGLSRRQFYRDLARARGFVERELDAPFDAVPASVPPSDGEARLQTAIALASAGHGRTAVEHFAPIVARLLGEAAAWGHCVLADLQLDNGDVAGARRELKVAVECAGSDGIGADRARLTGAKLLQYAGAAQAARELEDLVARLDARGEDSSLAVDTLSEALALLAFCYHERGDFAAAETAARRNPASSPGRRVSAFARRQSLNVNAMLACDADAGPRAAQQSCDAFYRFAVANGFLDDVSAALLQSSGIARFERRLDEAQRLAAESLAIQRTIGSTGAPVLGMLAAIAVDAGDYARGQQLARETRAAAPAGSHTWWATYLHEAEALARSRDHREALRICRRVAREAGDRDARIAAWRSRVEGLAYDALGDRARAYRAAGMSLDILGDRAPPFHRLKSLLVAQQIRPSRRRREQIRDLTALLGWNEAPV